MQNNNSNSSHSSNSSSSTKSNTNSKPNLNPNLSSSTKPKTEGDNAKDNTPFNMTIEHFKMCLKEYLILDSEIKKISNVLRDKRNKYDSLSQTLLLYLQKNNINEVQLEGDYEGMQLISQKLTKVKNVNGSSILDIIKRKLGNNTNLLESILKDVENCKEKDEVDKIKIQTGKNRKSKLKTKQTTDETNNLLMNVKT